jgi:hypothetical protein
MLGIRLVPSAMGATARRRGCGSGIGAVEDVTVGSGGGADVCSCGVRPDGTVGRYHPHYRLSLGMAGGSDAAACDWSI